MNACWRRTRATIRPGDSPTRKSGRSLPVVTTTPDPRVATEWMAAQINEHGELYQHDAAEHIAEHFGEDLTYENDNGNLAIKDQSAGAG
jgi:hypothetical protein